MSESQEPNAPPRRTLPLIASISGLFGAQWGMLGPLVPLYVLHLGYSFAWLGVVVAAQGAFQFFLRFFGGVMADRFGEQLVLRVGFIGMLIGSVIFAFSESIAALIGAQLFIGVSRAVYNPAGQSYASRISETDRARVIGKYRSAEALGMALGPMAGGALVAWQSFEVGFGLIATVNAVALVGTFFLPNIPRKAANSFMDVIKPIPAMVRSKPLLLTGIFTFGLGLAPAAFFTLIIAIFKDSGVSTFENGLLVSLFFAVGSATAFGFGRIARRLGQPLLFAITMGSASVAFLAIAATGGMPWAIPIIMFWGGTFTLGITLRTVMTAQWSLPEQRGIAVSYTGSFWALAQFIGPIVFGVSATAIGLKETLVALAIFAGLYAIAGPLLYRAMAPGVETKAQPEATQS